MTERQKKRLADQIRAAIRSSELSRYEIARQTGVHEASLSRFVNGKGSLSFESIERLAPVLGLKIVASATKKK